MFDDDFLNFLLANEILNDETDNEQVDEKLINVVVNVDKSDDEEYVTEDNYYDEKDKEIDDYLDELELQDELELIKKLDKSGELDEKAMRGCPFDADYLITFLDDNKE